MTTNVAAGTVNVVELVANIIATVRVMLQLLVMTWVATIGILHPARMNGTTTSTAAAAIAKIASVVTNASIIGSSAIVVLMVIKVSCVTVVRFATVMTVAVGVPVVVAVGVLRTIVVPLLLVVAGDVTPRRQRCGRL